MKKITFIIAALIAMGACSNGGSADKKPGDTPVVKKDTGYRFDSSTQPHGIDKQ